MAVEVFVGDQPGLAPAAANPNIAVTAVSPVTGHPNRMGMWAWRPATGRPDPVAAPFPAARNPEPNVQRPGSNRHDFNLHWRRGLRLGYDDLTSGRWRAGWRRGRWRRCHGDRLAFINHTAREQRQAGGDYKAFG